MRRSTRTRWLLVAATAALALLATAVLVRPRFSASPEQLLTEARAALKRAEYERAVRLATRVPSSAPEFPQACLVAGESATKLNDLRNALEYYRRVPDDGSEASLLSQSCAGDILLRLGRPAGAERNYLRVLAQRPDDVATRAQLATLLTAHGRRWESVPHLMSLIRAGRFSVDHLLWLGNTQSAIDLPAGVREAEASSATDPNFLIALSRSALEASEHSEAETLARKAIVLDPEQIEAWAVLGNALVHSSPEDLIDWHRGLPSAARRHPDIWLVQGLWARSREQNNAAVRCFWECLRLDPNHRMANYQLGQALALVGRAEDAAGFLYRAERLQELEGVLHVIYRGKLHLASMLGSVQRAALAMESLGRLWEAAAWARVGLTSAQRQSWALEVLQRTSRRLNPELPQVAPESNPAHLVDLWDFSLPEWSDRPAPRQSAEATPPGVSVRFTDDAAQAGIEFQYFNGYTPASKGVRMFAATGGGIAVHDFDGDGWPDLYFTQGCRWPVSESDAEHRDRLYRNLGNGRFEDTTGPAQLGDNRYSQGVTAGDFDSDGFPDLYVANVGPNRLYRNNGDGTFRDISAESGIQDAQWTSSCLLADVNGDSFPDLYDVNYLSGPRAYELICRSERGEEQICNPNEFEAAQDQLYLNLQDGRFQEVTSTAGIVVPDGKGLGIVAADFEGSGRLNLFVANDTTANFYFANETPVPGAAPVFRERALTSGLAFSGEGAAQACMGIAVDDADGDGQLDLFVTNYYRESNTFYRQVSEGLYIDGTREAGLRDPSFWLLGFGTQFLDADLDGQPDLVITNGHVSDFTSDGQPYQMPPQFLRNVGGGKFVEMPGESLGPFFERAHVGRGLARLDWNRDGREDFIVSHLGGPAALATNRSEPTGHFLSFELRGVASSRDAVGTTVRVEAGGRVRVRQLTAGDGYYVANQPELVFGLGPAEHVSAMTVQWPSGLEQTFENVPADRAYLLVEGRELIQARPVR